MKISCGTAVASIRFVHPDGPHVHFSSPCLESDVNRTVRPFLPPGWELEEKEDRPPVSGQVVRKLIAPTHVLLEQYPLSPGETRYWVRATGRTYHLEGRALAYFRTRCGLSHKEAEQRVSKLVKLRISETEAAHLAVRYMGSMESAGSRGEVSVSDAELNLTAREGAL